MMVSERFWPKVDKNGPIPAHRPDLGPCWHWNGSVTSQKEPYGVFRDESRKKHRAHKYAYERIAGPVPAGLVLDHLCRNRLCVNPKHLEPTTNRENILRGTSFSAVNARKTHCIHGHPLTGKNVKVYGPERKCATCRRLHPRTRNWPQTTRTQREMLLALEKAGHDLHCGPRWNRSLDSLRYKGLIEVHSQNWYSLTQRGKDYLRFGMRGRK